MELETGGEAFIPKSLSQDSLPYSFRYYDFIIAFVSEHLSMEKREELSLKQTVAYDVHHDNDIKILMLERLGLKDDGKEKEKE